MLSESKLVLQSLSWSWGKVVFVTVFARMFITGNATTPAEFETACAAVPPGASDFRLLVLPDQLICYAYIATLANHATQKATCQTPVTHLGVGEMFRLSFPNQTYHAATTIPMVGYQFIHTAAKRLDTSGPHATGWFWYDNVTRPAIPVDVSDWKPGSPVVSNENCASTGETGLLLSDGGLIQRTSCNNPYVAICEYYYPLSVCVLTPAAGTCDNVFAQQHPYKSSFKSLYNQEGTISILANHTNVNDKVQCLGLCHSDCQCLAATFKANVKHCLLHWVSPNEECFTSVPNTNATIYYEH